MHYTINNHQRPLVKRAARRLAAAVLLAAILIVTAAPGPVAAGGSLSPQQMLTAYYDLINARDFATAYRQWVTPPQTYNQFVTGYNDTVRVEAYIGSYQPGLSGQMQGRVPGYLVGHRTNGTQAVFQGCFDVAYNPAESGIRSWLIAGADVWPVNTLPMGTMFPVSKNFDCYDRYNADGSYNSVFAMLADYYRQINIGAKYRAYDLWINPVQTLAQFEQGWSDTQEAVMFYGSYQWSGSPNLLETGRVPVVLLGYHYDGSVAVFQGCISVNYSVSLARRWSIVGANLTPLPAPPGISDTTALLNQSCW